MSTCKALSAAVALSAALALTAVPASATTPPTTLASALAALTAAQAQVRAAISDEATTSVATWDAQMKAALAAEALAEAQLRPFLVPPATTDFGVTHSFVYKTGVPYTVQLNPINGSSNGGASQGPCLAGAPQNQNLLESGVCYYIAGPPPYPHSDVRINLVIKNPPHRRAAAYGFTLVLS